MASDDDIREDAEANAYRFRTIWTNSLFDRDDGTFRVFSFGRNFRFKKSILIWGGLGLTVSLLLHFLVISHVFPESFSWMVGIIVGFVITFLSIQIGEWSPMQKYTGEDLLTYLGFMIRRRLAVASSGKGRPVHAQCTTYAVPNHPNGRKVDGAVFIGTQPLRGNAHDIVIEDDTEDMEFYFYPRGQMYNLDGGHYNSHPLHRKLS